MKAAIVIALLASVLGFAQDGPTQAWKGKNAKAVVWNNDPRLYPESGYLYNARIEIVLENGTGSNTVYYCPFNAGGSGQQTDFALNLFNTAREAVINKTPFWLLINEDFGIIGVAVGPDDPSILPLSTSRPGVREFQTGAGGPARVRFPRASGPRDILGRSLRP